MNPVVSLLLLVLCTLCACKEKKKTNSLSTKLQAIDKVRGYYAKAEKLKLPFLWKNTGNVLPVPENKIIRLAAKDTVIFGEDAPQLVLTGVLADTSKFYTFLFYYPGDDLLPYIITIDKKGKIIDRIKTGYNCGADCGFYCMEGNFTINTDLSFLSQHKSYRAECDEALMNMDTTTVTYWVLERKGKILLNGKMKEDEEIVKVKREMPFNSPENPLNKKENMEGLNEWE